MSFAPTLNPKLKKWLENFRKKHDRPLRVLHIGNIAGNAYSNAKLQRRIGIDAYFIEDQDKYIMSQPEWEDADFEGDWGCPFQPNWENVDFKGYKRPDWVMIGDLSSCFIKVESIFRVKKSKLSIMSIIRPINLRAINIIRSISFRIINIIISTFYFLFKVLFSFTSILKVFFVFLAYFLDMLFKIFCIIVSHTFNVLKAFYKSVISHLVLTIVECNEIILNFFPIIAIRIVKGSTLSPYVRKRLYQYIKREHLLIIYEFLIKIGTSKKKKKVFFATKTDLIYKNIVNIAQKIRTCCSKIREIKNSYNKIMISIDRKTDNFSKKINKIKYNINKVICSFFRIINEFYDEMNRTVYTLFKVVKEFHCYGKEKILQCLSTRSSLQSEKRYKNLIKEFQKFFPDRPDQLTYSDILPYIPMSKIWEKIFVYFDVVQCYGGHPMWGALTESKKYVALEHGTLRDFPFENGGFQRLVALGYRKAQHTFITNGDCIIKAKKLGLKNYTPMIHPTDTKPFREVTSSKIKEVRLRYKADILLVSPMRHDWDVKGNDHIIRALPSILETTHKTVVLVLCEWGQEIDRSKKLIKDLNLEQNIYWIRPLPKIQLAQYFNAADVVLDQMILPCFGGIVPQSLSSGTPVIMSYDPQSTAWMFPEPAPVLPAFTSEDITNQVIKALNPTWRKDFKEKAKKWVDTYHSPEFLMNGHLFVYKRIIKSKSK